MRVLLAEDDRMIARPLIDLMRAAGYAMDWVETGVAAQAAVASHPYDALVLDLGLPGKDGISVLRTLRAQGNRVPVLIITARDAVRQRIEGLDVGGDDYLVKPFDVDELLARLRALLRRSSSQLATPYRWKDVYIDAVSREASVGGVAATLSGREWAVLDALLRRPGAVLSRVQLEEKLYSWDEEVSSNAVEVYVHGLRRKLRPDVVITQRGIGYLLRRPDPS